MDEATRLVARVLDVDLSSVVEDAASGDRFERRASWGFRSPPDPRFRAPFVCLADYTMGTTEPVVVHDLGQDTRFHAPLLLEEGVVSAVCVVIHVPVDGGGMTYGTLFAGTRSCREFEHGEIDFLGALADILGAAMYRRRAEEQLRESQERFELLSRAVNDVALLALDPEGTIASWNAPAERLLGWRGETVVGKNVADLGAEEDALRGSVDALLKSAASAGQVEAVVGLLRSDGSRFRASIIVLALRHAGEETVRGFALSVRDVTAQFEAEAERARLTAEIQRQRDTLRAVIEQMPLGIVVIDNPDGRFQLVNRHMRALWNRPFELGTIMAGHADEYPSWFPDGRRLRDEDYGAARALRGETVRQELIHRRTDGTVATVVDGAAPIYDRDGHIIGSVAALSDITEEKAMTRERERLLEEARRAVRARDDILAIVSHDLRNPLGVITLASSQLEHRADGADAATICSLAGRIHRAASGMEQIIGDLLDFARIEMGRLVVDSSDQNIADVVGDAVDGFAMLAAQRGVEIRTSLGALAGVHLRCDRRRLLQVLSNLLGNALKFVPRGRGIEVGGDATATEAIVFVRDEGPGIQADHIPHVFDRYWQFDAKDPRRGLGLGLAIVKGVVAAHGGRVWVESPPDEGATFAFALPLGDIAR